MGGKRKRNRPAGRAPDDNKRQRLSASLNSKTAVVKQALLAQYYPKVVSLREYLLLKLPTSSKVRRKKILSLGHKSHVEETEQENQSLAEFLDNVLVGISPCAEPLKKVRLKQWNSFSQRGDVSVSTLANVSGAGVFSQSEVRVFPLCCLECSCLSWLLTTNFLRLWILPSHHLYLNRMAVGEPSICYAKAFEGMLVLVQFTGTRILPQRSRMLFPRIPIVT